MISEKAMDYVVSLVETSGKSHTTIANAIGISKSTLSRLVNNRQATLFTIDLLIAYFERGEEWQEIVGEDTHHTCHLVADIRKEIKHIEDMYAERESRMQQQYAERLSSINAQMDMLRQHHEQALAKRDETYERSTAYLKQQVATMQEERKENQEEIASQRVRAEKAEAHAENIDRRRHNVFWGMLAALIVVTIGFCIALFSPSIV